MAVAALLAPGVGARQAPDALSELFARGRAAQSSTKTLTASFTETTVSTLLRDPVVAHGTLLVELPLRVVMNYTTPTARTMALDESKLILVGPGRTDREELDISTTQKRVKKYFTDASPDQLRQIFTVTLDTDDARNAYRLELVPKRKQVAQGLSRLRIWVDRTRLVMVRMTMDYPSGDGKIFDLRDIRTNVALPADAFAILNGRR